MTAVATLSLVAVRRARAAAGGSVRLPAVRAVLPGRASGPREERLIVGAEGREGGRHQWARGLRGAGEARARVGGTGPETVGMDGVQVSGISPGAAVRPRTSGFFF